MKHLTVRQKVVFWYSAMLVLIAVAVFLIIHFSGAQQASVYVSETLQSATESARDEIELDDGELELDGDLDDIDSANVMIYDSTGSAMLYGRIPEFDLPLQEGAVREVAGDSGRTWYVYDSYYPVGGNSAVWIRTCMVMDSVSSVESYSTSVFLWMIIPLSALAALGGYAITRRAFQPVVQITNTARSIANGDDLTKRIGLHGQKDEFGQLADTFDEMFSRLQQSFDQEKRFASDASHELRTPLSVIRTQCDYALERGNEAEKTQALHVIRTQTERMSGLVNQLLLFSRMDSGTQALQKEQVDLSQLFESVADELSPKAEEYGIEIRKDIKPNLHVYADELQTVHMLVNLLENAIRFGREGGYILLALKEEKDGVRGTVEDNGVGISDADLPHIWDRFYQADAARSAGSESNNSGLGLSIVRLILEAHNGDISVKSSYGQGSVFTFFIPTGHPPTPIHRGG